MAEFASITKDLPRKVVTGIRNLFQIFWPAYHVLSVPFHRARGRARPSTSRTTNETQGDSPAKQSADTSMETQESSAKEQNSATSESPLDSTASQETPRLTSIGLTLAITLNVGSSSI